MNRHDVITGMRRAVAIIDARQRELGAWRERMKNNATNTPERTAYWEGYRNAMTFVAVEIEREIENMKNKQKGE